MREIFLRQLIDLLNAKVKKEIEINAENDLIYSAIAVLLKEREQSERAVARLQRPTRCAGGGCTSPTLDVVYYLKPARAKRVGS